MLKKIESLKIIGQKTAQVSKIGKSAINKITHSDSLADAKEQINEAVNRVFISVKAQSNEFMNNDEDNIKAADLAYKAIPPPVKIVLRKKRFRKIVLQVRDKCTENSNLEPDQCSLEVINESTA